jgi:hypothetical protein
MKLKLKMEKVVPGFGSASKNLSIFDPKKLVLSSQKYDPGFSSWIPDPDLDFFYPISDPGIKKATDPGSATLENGGQKTYR